MLFKVTDNDFFKDNPSAEWVEEFKVCTSDQMKYIMLAYSYDTPYKRLSIDDKKEKSLERIKVFKNLKNKYPLKWKKVAEGNDELVNSAIRELRRVTRDDAKETLIAYDEQLDQFRELMRKKDKSDKELDQSLKVVKELPKFLENRKEIMETLNLRDDDMLMDEDDNQEYSTLETILEKDGEV